jgi:hypothetical protein
MKAGALENKGLAIGADLKISIFGIRISPTAPSHY